MEININKVFDSLLGKQVVNLSRLALVNYDKSWEILTDTFVFALSNGQYFQALADQEKVIFKEIVSNKEEYMVSFPIEANELITISPIEEQIEVPFIINSITEIWSGKKDLLLVAVKFFDEDRENIFSLLTETDDIVLLKEEENNLIIEQMIFDYHLIIHHWYD